MIELTLDLKIAVFVIYFLLPLRELHWVGASDSNKSYENKALVTHCDEKF